MSCGCSVVEKSPLWTPVPEYRQPTDIQPGENIDCYMKRAGSQSGLKNDIGPKIPDRIDNTSLTSDLHGVVNEKLQLTPGSTRTATTWTATVDSQPLSTAIPHLSLDAATGNLTGTVQGDHLNKNYKVLVTAADGAGTIDSREFNFFPKDAKHSDVIKFVIPLAGNSHVTCGFGPRTPPAPGASSMHMGYDFAMVDHSHGTIVAAADGVVRKTGPASGFGNWIIIDHNDSSGKLVCSTLYAHMNNGNTFVKVGDKVAAGQKIAIEGNAGVGSGAHLHFELHKGGYKNPVDPGPYLHGAVTVANNNDPTAPQQDGTTAPAGGFSTRNNTAVGMTAAEAQAGQDCPDTIPNPSPDNSEPVVATGKATHTSSCKPADYHADPAGVEQQIRAECAAQGLDSSEADFIVNVAKIESGLDPYAKCPTSSATGLFQFLDALATKYYGRMSVPPTCANRCNVAYATRAMCDFYKSEMRPAWDHFVASGKTKIVGKQIKPTSWSGSSAPYYASLTRSQFLYGLVHHDGVGSAVNGKDLGGVQYWRKKIGNV